MNIIYIESNLKAWIALLQQTFIPMSDRAFNSGFFLLQQPSDSEKYCCFKAASWAYKKTHLWNSKANTD